MPPQRPFFKKIVTLTLPDDLELGTNKKVLSQGIPMPNMKALTLTNQKIWPMLKFFCGQTSGQMDKQTAKNYMTSTYRCRGIKYEISYFLLTE